MSTITRWDETWHRLLAWTNDQAPSERLAAQILLHEGFESLDPSHPLGGKDRGKDATCEKGGRRWVMGVYFPRGQQLFSAIKEKFLSDLAGARGNNAEGFAFVTNQELRLAERSELLAECDSLGCEIFHLERITVILDSPPMQSVRKQFLNIDFGNNFSGGKGGDAKAIDGATAVGGRGGLGGPNGAGGDGGRAEATGSGSFAMGGDGGNACTPDGRGGRRTMSPGERMNMPTDTWRFGYGGAGGNVPEYNRRLVILQRVRSEYYKAFPDDVPIIEAGIDPVPIAWVNKRLEELGEEWRVEGLHEGGYIMPVLAEIDRVHR